jgi:wyosine [tRNA(Phe)-imidazoG37] synthetase (radical SAM superfamily)
MKMTKGFKHVYGPVPSRRLGRSLGIDLAPFKTCTYDCVYCHLGRTTNKTIERKAYAAVDDILEELKRKLNDGPAPAGGRRFYVASGQGKGIETVT